jgi:hypothetical protein
MMVKPREVWNFGVSGNVVVGRGNGRQGRIVKLICFVFGANRNVSVRATTLTDTLGAKITRIAPVWTTFSHKV